MLVIGGGNTAVEEALFLTNFAAKVTLVHRRDSLRAEKILQERLFKHPKIELVWDSVLDDVRRREDPLKVTHARLKNIKTGAVTERAVDGVFIAIGHKPATELVAGQVEMKPLGLHQDRPAFDRDLGRRRVRRRRRRRRSLPPGGDRRRTGLHGRARGRTFPRRACRSSAPRRNKHYFSPPCGEKSSREARRMRGHFRESEPSGEAPSPRPSPRTRGEGESDRWIGTS